MGNLGQRRWGRGLRIAAVAAMSLLMCAPLWAARRSLKTTVHNCDETPIEIKRSKVILEEAFTTPTLNTQPGSRVRTSRVRYANRAGRGTSSYVLNGEVRLANVSRQAVEAISLTILLYDAFHEPVQGDLQAAPDADSELAPSSQRSVLVEQIVEPLRSGASKKISWERTVLNPDVYEVATVVTHVRFADGEVWRAPEEELEEAF